MSSLGDTDRLITDLLDKGFNRELGFVIADWQNDSAELQQQLSPQLLNRSDILHGGVVGTLIDVCCGLAGCYCNEPGNVRRAVTLSLNIQFVDTVTTGAVSVRARKRAGGYRIFFADADVLADDGRLLATGQGTYQYVKGSETLAGMPLDDRT